jgi:membrane-bound lytic murein transglycosylase A
VATFRLRRHPTARFERVAWDEIPDWTEAQTDAWPAWLKSCAVFRLQPQSASWHRPCTAAASIAVNDAGAQRRYFEANFTPYRVANPDGSTSGLVTGYYEPLLQGSRGARRAFAFRCTRRPPTWSRSTSANSCPTCGPN